MVRLPGTAGAACLLTVCHLFSVQRFALASGRFAVIDDGLGFQLVPWSPSLETTAGSSGTSGENAVWDYSANSVVSGFRGVIAIRR